MPGLRLYLLGCLVGALAHAGDVNETARLQLSPVPRVSAPPQIDGGVDKREWSGATLLPNLIHSQKGLVADNRTCVYVSYDDTALYVAFQIERTEKARKPAETDEVEMRLDAGHGQKEPVTFRGNIAAPGQFKVRATEDFGWEGEIAIPFASLHRSAPADGETWGFDFIDRQRTPFEETMAYSFGEELSHLIFVRDVPPLRFLQTGTFVGEAGSGAVLEILNLASQPSNLSVSLEILRRNPDAKGSYLPALVGGITDTPDIILPGTLADVIKEELAKYTSTANTNATLNLPANRRTEVRLSVEQPADYLLKYRVTRGAQTISAGALPYRLTPPMQMTLRPYSLALKIVEAKVDLHSAKEWEAGAKVKVTIAPSVTAEQPFADKREFSVALPIDQLAPGGYRVTMELIGKDGKSKGTINEGFRKPPTPDWMINRAGLLPAVPKPWIPIKAKANQVSFLMGEYKFGDSFLPEQINVRSIYEEKRAPLLTGPMSLTGKVNGKEIVWSKSQNKIASKSPELVTMNGETTFENLAVSATTEFEYDGMAKVSLKIKPSAGSPPAIDELTLEIPLAKEFASLGRYGPSTGEPSSNPTFKNGAVPAEGARSEFLTTVWLGNEERGLSWFAENTKGWRVAKKFHNEEIEIVPRGNATVLRIHLVRDEQPFVLEKSREIVFGYMFSPVRTPRVKLINHGMVHEQMPATVGSHMNNGEIWFFPLQGWPIIGDARLKKVKADLKGEAGGWDVHPKESMQKIIALAHQYGSTVTPYTGWFLPVDCDEYPVFGEELVADPWRTGGCGTATCCWNTPMADLESAHFRDRIAELGIDGYRSDAGWQASPCDNPFHAGYGSQCGWIDDDGKRRESRTIFAARRMSQRMYRLFHNDQRDAGPCIMHVHFSNRYDPILSHVEAVQSVEGGEMKAKSLKEFSLAFYRANIMGDAHGWQVVYMAKAAQVGYDARIGMCLLHNFSPRGTDGIMNGVEQSYSRRNSSPTAVWEAREWIGPFEKGTELWGYWKNGQYLDTGNADVKGTFQVQRGKKLLLGLVNLERAPVATSVRLDLKALGFSGKVYAYDPVLRETVALDNGKMQVTFTPESYRVIEIASKPFDIFVPEKVSSNLIAEPDTSKWEGWHYGESNKASRVERDDVRMVGSDLVIKGNTDTQTRLNVPTTKLEQGRPYLLEAEVHSDCTDKMFMGKVVEQHYFWLSLGETYRYRHDFRSFGSQMLPGQFEKVRIYFIPGKDKSTVEIRSEHPAGTLTIRNLGLYELAAAPPWAKHGQ